MSTTTNLGLPLLDSGTRQPEIPINAALNILDAGPLGLTTTAWISWTPTWVNLTVGNGTVTARYKQIGKLVFCRLHVVFGSTTSIGGSVTVSNPVTRLTYGGTATVTPLGMCRLFDTSAGTANEGYLANTSPTTSIIAVWGAGGAYVAGLALSSTVPFTWATGDEINAQFSYEAA